MRADEPKESPPVEDGLSVRGLAARYGSRTVWNNVGFDVRKGQIIALTGGNGAGKSTLAKVLCGLKKPWRGSVFWCGRKMAPKALTRLAFMVMQDVNAQLFADSVLEEVMLGVEDTPENHLNAQTCLEACGLSGLDARHPMTLSGGQKQRLAVADAMVENRGLVVFDEPTSGLDYGHMMRFVSILKRMAESGCVILVITHDMEFIAESGASVLEMPGA